MISLPIFVPPLLGPGATTPSHHAITIRSGRHCGLCTTLLKRNTILVSEPFALKKQMRAKNLPGYPAHWAQPMVSPRH